MIYSETYHGGKLSFYQGTDFWRTQFSAQMLRPVEGWRVAYPFSSLHMKYCQQIWNWFLYLLKARPKWVQVFYMLNIYIFCLPDKGDILCTGYPPVHNLIFHKKIISCMICLLVHHLKGWELSCHKISEKQRKQI